MLLLLLSLLSLPARADSGKCVETMAKEFEAGVRDRNTAIQRACALRCPVYTSKYCGSIKPGQPFHGDDLDDKTRRLFQQYLHQQRQQELVDSNDMNDVITQDGEIAMKARRRAASLLGAQANETEEELLKPIWLKAQMEWHRRFSALQSELEAAPVNNTPKGRAALCAEIPGVAAQKKAITNAYDDIVEALRGGKSCLETQAEELRGRPN